MKDHDNENLNGGQTEYRINLGMFGEKYMENITKAHINDYLKNKKDRIGCGAIIFGKMESEGKYLIEAESYGGAPDVINLLVSSIFRFMENLPPEEQVMHCFQIGGAFLGKAATTGINNGTPLPFICYPGDEESEDEDED